MNQQNPIPRLLSLDVFRGLTIAVMILVNSPGKRVAYSWLEHSAWNGCTLADLVFPFFIVIVGVSSVLALTNLKTKAVPNKQLLKIIAKRSAYLFIMGLILNVLPNHFDFANLRILGVLQRIALCYFFSSVLFLTTKPGSQIAIIIVLLIGYWLLITWVAPIAPLSMNNNLVGYLDRLILSPDHLYTPWFDPEGLLSTVPAIGSILLGNLLGFCLISSRTKQQQLHWIIFTGLGLLILGGFWSLFFPLNKLLWSSSYVLWTGGLAYLVFAICFKLIELKQCFLWSKPFSLFGKNAMLAYILHVLFLKIQAIILVPIPNGELINLRLYITDSLFSHLPPQTASFCYAISYTLFWLLVLKLMSRWQLQFKSIIAPK